MALQRATSAGFMTNYAARLLVRELERRLAPLGLTPAHMPVFLALEDGKALPQKALAERAEVEQPTMTATLNRMERDGLVARSPNPDDGRSMLVALTPMALEKLQAVEAAVSGINDLVLGALSPDEAAQYFALLGRVIAVLEEGDKR